MSIRFACPVCKTSYSVADSDAGKKSDCKSCGQRLQVPTPAAPRMRTVLGETMPEEQPRPVRTPRERDEPVPIPMPSYLSRSSGKSRMRVKPALTVIAACLILLGTGATVLIRGVARARQQEAALASRTEPGKNPPPASLPVVRNEPASKESGPRKPVVEEEDEVPPASPAVPLSQPLSGEQVYQKLVSCSVFLITPTGAGTGFVVDRERRLLVTNFHVVGREKQVAVLFPLYDEKGELITDASVYRKRSKEIAIQGRVILTEPSKDLALIQTDQIDPRATAATFASRPAATGSTLYSVGGSGVGENLLWRLTKGTVRGRVQRKQQAEFGQIDSMILESDAPLNHGDSGGPVMNDRGELVAVVSHGSAQQRQVSGNIDVEEVRKFVARHTRGD